MFKRKKVGLALSGGGARGLAHIGVLKILEKNKIPIDFIAGTSMGAFIGAMYSAGPNIKKLEKDFLDEPWKKSFDYNILPTQGLIKGDKIEKWLATKIGDIDFKDLRIPLFVTAFDLKSKREVIFSKGNVTEAVRASISIPGVFVPLENNGRWLVDGEIIDPIPSEILTKAGAEIIIAINVNAAIEKEPLLNETAVKKRDQKKLPSILGTLLGSVQKEESRISNYDLEDKNINLVINVYLNHVGMLEFEKIKFAIRAGEKATKKSLIDIKNLFKQNYLASIIDKFDGKEKVEEVVAHIKDVGKTASLGKILEPVEKLGKNKQLKRLVKTLK